jgi:hypothetical protein
MEFNAVPAKHKVYGPKLNGRSRITNGTSLLPSVDGRSIWARRCRDLIQLHEQDLSPGNNRLSQASRSLIRRAAVLSVELEHLELKFAQQEATAAQLELYARLSNTLRRLLQTIGTERVPRDVTPSLSEYIKRKRHGSVIDADVDEAAE